MQILLVADVRIVAMALLTGEDQPVNFAARLIEPYCVTNMQV